MQTHHIRNLDELDKFARAFAESLKGGDVIGLVGELGAGKTSFVQRLAAAIGVKEEVRSPTFVLMRAYDTGRTARTSGGSRISRPRRDSGMTYRAGAISHLCHVDAYRLKDEAELGERGITEYLGKPDTVTVIEWADRVPAIHALPTYREITFLFGEKYERILNIER